jgi:hypothetical protein
MLTIKKKSGWSYDTNSSGGLGLEFVAVEGGSIYMKDPDGRATTFHYGAVGAGYTLGLKLPKIGKLKIKDKSVGGVVGPSAFPSTGVMYILDSFAGEELVRGDITGVCMFAEIGGGLGGGGYALAMLMGMNPVWLGVAVATAPFLPLSSFSYTKLAQSATALILIAGTNVGLQAGGGVAGFIGGLI